MDVRLIDTTFRDGSQSLWACGIRIGMIEAVARATAAAGFEAVEVPVGGNHIKKLLRELKEDPWEMARMLARTMPDTIKASMAGAYLTAFDAVPPPREITQMFYGRLAEIGALNRVQVSANVTSQSSRVYPWLLPMFKGMGLQVVTALSYTISPRHTDEYYAAKTREVLGFKPDAIMLKDQGGLLTVDRIRTLLPVIIQNAGGVPVELHSHCTTGLAPLVYLEAIKLGVNRLHTGVPPLANDAGQPSVFNVVANARLMGHKIDIDETKLYPVSERLTAIAKQEKLLIGAPLEYDYAQYIHQVPGGVIANLRFQLAELGVLDRLDDILKECVQVRKELGYPIMITPHSQFVVSQAALNVMTGERYKVVIDEIIYFAQGAFGEDSGYPWMDQNLKDKLLGMNRAKELSEMASKRKPPTYQEVRSRLGGAGVSDEEFLLRYLMKGDAEIQAMRAAGPPRPYFNSAMPLQTLVRELNKHQSVRYVHVARGQDNLVVQNGAAH